jgi:hypothetical protein
MTKATSSAPRFGCPNCGGEDISENNVVSVLLKVSAWCDDGEPAGYQYPWREKGGLAVEDDKPRYHCDACDQDFEEVLQLH